MAHQKTKAEQQPAVQDRHDDIERLWVGAIDTTGVLTVDGEEAPAFFWGELLLDGAVDNGDFYAQGLRRLAFYGRLQDPPEDDPVGVFCLVGPPKIQELDGQAPREPQRARVLQELHYQALSDKEIEPRFRDKEWDDAQFPQVEVAMVDLVWRQEEDAGEHRFTLILEKVVFSELVQSQLGRVQAALLDPVPLTMWKAGSWESRPKPRYSLGSHCPPPPSPPCAAGQDTVVRLLPVKFINVSTGFDVEAICQQQMNGFCRAWSDQAALDLVVWPNSALQPNNVVESVIAEASAAVKANFSVLSGIQETTLPRRAGQRSDHHIEVYLVDALADRFGGGIAYDCGQASGYCIIDLFAAEGNDFLLAHELGHIVGLSHPGEQPCPGSAGSVLQPQDPNVESNTLFNCRVFTPQPEVHLNPIVRTTAIEACFIPDI